MTTKPVSRQKVKKLSVDWDSEVQFSLDPKIISGGKTRLLKSCTIAIFMRKLPARSPTPAARIAI